MVWLLVVSLILTQIIFISTASAASIAQKNRLYGSDRINTAIEISRAGWKSTSDYAVLVTANNFPDALCAAPLAKLYNAPLLLTDSNMLNTAVKAELQRLSVKNVIIVGGTGVVSDAVFNSVRQFASVQRIAGADREETSVEVAKRLGNPGAAVLATGQDFPDALSISSIAAAKGMPILLTGRDTLSDKVDKYLKDYGISTTYIVGGTGAISSAIQYRVPGAVRLAGSDRVQTNYEILNKFADGLDFNKVYIATALDFPDALSGSALAAMTSSPIVLADGTVLSSIKNLVKNKIKSNTEIIGLGGTAVVSNYIVEDVVGNINGEVIVPGSFAVQSVSAINRNYIKVEFSESVEEVSAESASSYLMDGVPLSSSDRIVLQPDRKTVYITLDNPMEQFTNKLFIVRDNAIFSENALKMVPKYEKVLTFSDAEVPAIKSVTASSDRMLTIEFSEPVKMPSSFIATLETAFKINGQFMANYGYSSAKVVEPTNMNLYSTKLELSFNSGIQVGTYTLSIPEGSSTYLIDASGFTVAKSNLSFTVSSVSSLPRIVSVAGQTNGTVYVTYDRAMDSATAEGEFLYYIGANNALAADFVSGSENKVVKLVFGANIVGSGANVLIIDKDIKDTSGNTLSTGDDDIRVSLNATDDKEKPKVLSVSLIDERRIRVRFSEPVEYSYAIEKTNYTLVDSDGFTVNYISSIASDGGSYSEIYTITLNTSLSSTGYRLKIRNLIDRAATPNTMDEYETEVNGTDNVSPTVIEVVVPDYSSAQAVVFFSEAMDVASITNRTQITYKDNAGTFRELPLSTTIEAGIDKKSITITFPTGYTVKTSGWVSQYDVKGIRIANAKDISGNLLADVVDYKDVVNAYNATSKPTYVKNSLKIYPNGENIKAEFELTQALAILRASDFAVAGQAPDSGQISGKRVILNYTNSDKVTAIRLAGPSASLSVLTNGSANVAGTRIDYFSSEKVFDDQVAPRLISVAATSGSEDTIALKFSERIDETVAGLYTDDFIFLGGGTKLSVARVTVSYDTVIYYFGSTAFERGSTVIAKAVESKASIKDLEDESKSQNIYRPSLNDISGISVTAE